MKENESLDFELKLLAISEKSKKLGWRFSFILLIALLSMIALYILKPLSVSVPYLVLVDKNTGVSEMLTSVTEKTMEYSEALDKSNAGQYVQKREQYHYTLLKNDYEYVQINSAKKVAEEYVNIYNGEKARDLKLGSSTEINVNLLSVTLGESAGIKNATVRIEEETLKRGNPSINKIKIITLSYIYKPELVVTEKERLVNPLGFKVIKYRIDEEVKQ